MFFFWFCILIEIQNFMFGVHCLVSPCVTNYINITVSRQDIRITAIVNLNSRHTLLTIVGLLLLSVISSEKAYDSGQHTAVC